MCWVKYFTCFVPFLVWLLEILNDICGLHDTSVGQCYSSQVTTSDVCAFASTSVTYTASAVLYYYLSF